MVPPHRMGNDAAIARGSEPWTSVWSRRAFVITVIVGCTMRFSAPRSTPAPPPRVSARPGPTVDRWGAGVEKIPDDDGKDREVPPGQERGATTPGNARLRFASAALGRVVLPGRGPPGHGGMVL